MAEPSQKPTVDCESDEWWGWGVVNRGGGKGDDDCYHFPIHCSNPDTTLLPPSLPLSFFLRHKKLLSLYIYTPSSPPFPTIYRLNTSLFCIAIELWCVGGGRWGTRRKVLCSASDLFGNNRQVGRGLVRKR